MSEALTEFTKTITHQFTRAKDVETRLEAASKLARAYNFTRPELVLLFTHPETSKLTMKERCEKLNITEEVYMLALQEDGFRRFLNDYRAALQSNTQVQAMHQVSQGLTEEHYRYAKDGTEIRDFTLETEVIKAMAQEKAGAQVNVQVNNVWTEARKMAGR